MLSAIPTYHVGKSVSGIYSSVVQAITFDTKHLKPKKKKCYEYEHGKGCTWQGVCVFYVQRTSRTSHLVDKIGGAIYILHTWYSVHLVKKQGAIKIVYKFAMRIRFSHV